MSGWRPEDSWVLFSLRTAPRRLDEVLWTMDWINRSIPSLDELRGAFGRLAAAGLVAIEPDGYALTEEGGALHARAADGLRDAHLVWNRLRAALQRIDCPPADPWPLTRAELERAHASYHERFRQA